MLRNSKVSVVMMLVSLNAFAGVQKSTEPLSGLNLEDFEASAKKNPEWDSNPFVKYGDAPAAKQMILYGIVWSESKSLALINSDVVKVGDKVGSSQVVAIEKAKVILRNSDGLYQITFKGAQNDKT